MNAELIKALRNCSCADGSGSCSICQYVQKERCKQQMMDDAANVIETLANPQVKIVPVARQYDDSAIYVQAVLSYSDGTVVTSEVAKVSTMPAQIPKWISVEDGLPEDRDEYGQGVDVLATDGIVTTRAFYGYPGGHDEWFINAGEQWEATFDRPVTHWMKLPKLPKADTRKGEEK